MGKAQTIFYLYVDLSPSHTASMKKGSILLLIFLSIPVYTQDKNDSLLNLLESAQDADRIPLLKELCWENRYSNPAEALSFGLEALSLVKLFESYEQEASIHNYLGIIQRNVGDHATALEYFFTARNIAEEQENLEDMAYANNNIGDIYNLENDYGLALKYETCAQQHGSVCGSTGISQESHEYQDPVREQGRRGLFPG
jgi:tetratricopeptide (TPR) repeat protein